MKRLLTWGTALSLALLVPALAGPTAPAAMAQDDIYWDAKIVPGADPYALVGKNLDGKTVSLDDYKGKVVVLDFWATWCPPCRAEIPNLKAQYKKYHSEGVEVLGISLDNTKDALTKYIGDNDMPWGQVFDREYGKDGNAAHYGVQAIPFMLVIGKDGKVAAVNARGEELEPALIAALTK